MKLQAEIAFLITSMCLFTGCQTVGSTPPDIQSLQTTQQEQNQTKLNNAIIG